MKRVGNLFDKICDLNNIILADNKARKNKTHTKGVMIHDQNREKNLRNLSKMLKEGTYVTSKYDTFKIYEPKERVIYRLPYFPDRIVHHAIMNVLEPIWIKLFIKNTYSCIKNRGIDKCRSDLVKVLKKYPLETTYCLKIDIKKFYPSINHDILYNNIIKRTIKDKRTLELLKSIIESADGVPIGNYLSQFFANLYLAYFDHWCKEVLKCKFYFRYADDITIFSNNKKYLHEVLEKIKAYLWDKLKLEVKSNHKIISVDDNGVDFVGYVFRHSYIKIRKSIKKNMFKTIYKAKKYNWSNDKLLQHLRAYFGWAKYSNSKYLLQKIESLTGFHFSNWRGKEILITNIYNKPVNLVYIDTLHSNFFKLQFTINYKSYSVISRNKTLLENLKNYKLPCKLIIKHNGRVNIPF